MTLDLTQLGNKVEIPNSPEEAIIEVIPNSCKSLVNISFNCPEFTSLCRVTGQPDFGIITINYVPNNWLIESKSLKLFLGSFRNERIFHEEVVDYIANRLFDAIGRQRQLIVNGIFNPRGGISITASSQLTAYNYCSLGSPGSGIQFAPPAGQLVVTS